MKKLFILLFSFLTITAQAASSEGGEFKPGDMITHHIADDYSWHFADGAVLYLPVILIDNGKPVVFSSSNFYNENHELVPYNGYKMEHGHIYKVNAAGEPIEGYKGLYDISITKNVASMFVSVALLFFVFFSIAGSYKKNAGRAPRGMQSFFEPIIIFIRDEIAKANIGPKYERYMPYLLTIFFFIWFNNLLGLMPGGANLTGNIAVTLVLATMTLLITVFSGNKSYWGHIFATPGVPKWLAPIMIPVELIGIFTKPFSLMVRLFANITAGHIIILSLFSLIFIFQSIAVGPLSVAFATFMNFLELFVALLQAYIFTLLSAMYFGGAVEEHDHVDDMGHGDGHH
ncbi:F0F1 ATP synthase subunit A [Pontibacter sp. KCTC 32443]|uniref:F0F1 ATP synthase subunit A n=1 Tax=Pontibacter TaxID=323449 RepID=UPI00164ED3D2|nr:MULTISPECIES: F0F1 ATP synthase subunit A [Pontibacter]MBC5775817.1 F0F1 ATP synthase subunit A [Pontibacter sp. KCTC 32443]